MSISISRILLVAALAVAVAGCGASKPTPETTPTQEEPPPVQLPVHAEVALFIMPTCPHCAAAMNALLPLYKETNGAMALAIGHLANTRDPRFPDTGNAKSGLIQLCAETADQGNRWMDFLACAYEGNTWETLETTWEACAEKTDIDKGAVQACIDSGEGEKQLIASTTMAVAAGIESVPTIFIDGEIYGGPLDRESFLQHFCYAYGKEETRPPLCDEVTPMETVTATLLVDERCNDEESCNVDDALAVLASLMPALEMETVDYGSEAGKALYDRIVAADGPKTLPTMVFDETLMAYPTVVAMLERYLQSFEGGFTLLLGVEFDPTMEICDNQVDDNGDGLVDCDDANCANQLLCREEKKERLDLFIMSQCPFGMMLMPAVDAYLKHMKEHLSWVELRLQFIGTVGEDGTLQSMHGPAEVAEDLRMVCIQDLYPKKHAFMEYMMCRAKNYRSDDWESCLPKTMKKKKIEKCATGEKGQELLKASFTLATETGMRGSPSWLLNNRYEMNARTAAQVLEAYCEQNDAPACSKVIPELLIDRHQDAPGQCE